MKYGPRKKNLACKCQSDISFEQSSGSISSCESASKNQERSNEWPL